MSSPTGGDQKPGDDAERDQIQKLLYQVSGTKDFDGCAEQTLTRLIGVKKLDKKLLDELARVLDKGKLKSLIPPRVATHELTYPDGTDHPIANRIVFRVRTTDPRLVHEIDLLWSLYLLEFQAWPGDGSRYQIPTGDFVETNGIWVANVPTIFPATKIGFYIARYWVEGLKQAEVPFEVV